MNAYTKKLFRDWKTYVMIISTVMMVFVDCSDCDYLSAVWVVLAFALWCYNYILQIGITDIAGFATDIKSCNPKLRL